MSYPQLVKISTRRLGIKNDDLWITHRALTPVRLSHDRFGNMFAPCLTCGNKGQEQGAHLFPHSVHKIRHMLWTMLGIT